MNALGTDRGGRTIRSILAWSYLGTIAVFAAGCGTGTYVDRLNLRLEELQRTSPFAVLTGQPTDDLPVNFRVPLDCTRVYAINSADPVDATKPIARDRVMPDFLQDGVGFRRSFEGMYIDNLQAKTPYYLYAWMFDAPTSKGGLDLLRNYLRNRLADPKADWESVDVKTPKGTTLNWKRLRLKSAQKYQTFEVERNGTLQDEQPPGIFELWYCDTPGYDVLLGWRASQDAWDKGLAGDAKLQDLPELVAGTLVMPTSGSRNMKKVPTTGIGTWVPGGRAAAPPKVAGNPGGAVATPPVTAIAPTNPAPAAVPTTPATAPTPTPAGATAANGATVHIGSAAAWGGHPYSITFPTGWEKNGTAASFVPPGSPAGTLPEIVSIELRELPETVGTFQLFNRTQKEFSQGLQDVQQVSQSDQLRVADMSGEFRIVSGTENGHPRKMVLYLVRRGAVFVIFQGLFNESNYDAMKVKFDAFVQSFHWDDNGMSPAPPPTNRPIVAPPTTNNPVAPPLGVVNLDSAVAPDGGPAAAPPAEPPAVAGPPTAAPPAKTAPVPLEFPDKTTGTIEFPAGFQQNGKTPEASTAPPMGAGAAAEPPDTIKIQTAKLGPGVNFADLRKQTVTEEMQSAPGGKFFDKGSCTVAGATGEFFVIDVTAQGNANQKPRKRVTFLVSLTAKRVAVKIVADVSDANYKTLKDELKASARSLKIE